MFGPMEKMMEPMKDMMGQKEDPYAGAGYGTPAPGYGRAPAHGVPPYGGAGPGPAYGGPAYGPGHPGAAAYGVSPMPGSGAPPVAGKADQTPQQSAE